ncbi:hypothetical protein KM043_001338 [Ampulex compressa]|nr:hypothetical protein KM043_001338 [Ampulex compressa]
MDRESSDLPDEGSSRGGRLPAEFPTLSSRHVPTEERGAGERTARRARDEGGRESAAMAEQRRSEAARAGESSSEGSGARDGALGGRKSKRAGRQRKPRERVGAVEGRGRGEARAYAGRRSVLRLIFTPV